MKHCHKVVFGVVAEHVQASGHPAKNYFEPTYSKKQYLSSLSRSCLRLNTQPLPGAPIKLTHPLICPDNFILALFLSRLYILLATWLLLNNYCWFSWRGIRFLCPASKQTQDFAGLGLPWRSHNFCSKSRFPVCDLLLGAPQRYWIRNLKAFEYI